MEPETRDSTSVNLESQIRDLNALRPEPQCDNWNRFVSNPFNFPSRSILSYWLEIATASFKSGRCGWSGACRWRSQPLGRTRCSLRQGLRDLVLVGAQSFERGLLLPGLELLGDQVRQRRESTDSGAGVSIGVRLDRDTNGLIAGLILRRELVESACRGPRTDSPCWPPPKSALQRNPLFGFLMRSEECGDCVARDR